MPVAPRISVIIVVFNRCDLIRETLESVENQTLPPIEVIVIDDRSTDDSVAVVKAYAQKSKLRIRILPNGRTKGIAGARNFGVQNATGELVAFQDSDDLWLPHHLQRLTEVLRSYPDVDMAFAAFEFFGSAKDLGKSQHYFRNSVDRCLKLAFEQKAGEVWLSNKRLLFTILKYGFPFRWQASLIRRDFFSKNAISIDEQVTYTSDAQFITLSSYYTPFLYVSKSGAMIRRHEGNDGEVSYAGKITNSFETRAAHLKEFFRDKPLNREERSALMERMWTLQSYAMQSRSLGRSVGTRFREGLKLIIRVPCWLSFKSFFKNVVHPEPASI